MRILMVRAHPVEASYHAAVAKTAMDALRAAGHEIDELDLYAEAFDPVLSRDERLAYHDLERNQHPGIKPYVERLQRAEALVLVFPVWSFGLPAILKGWMDRVFLPGVSFTLGADGVARPALTHLRKIAGIATYGRPWWLVTFGVGDFPRYSVTRYLKRLTGGRAKVEYRAHYDMNRSTPESRQRFLDKVRRAMARF
ncbi:MAG: NAD(P)H-dependent oxidoreductase [Alphaproteobacteria bacterium]|nr:NAD(P)H-dependent oxidoreductase [Alphaproteobacteria bacterium]